MSSYERQPRPSGADAINRKGIDAAAQSDDSPDRRVGYVGGHLLRRLERSKRRVRCLTRRPASLRQRVGEQTEGVEGDVLDRASVDSALPASRRASWRSARVALRARARKDIVLRLSRIYVPGLAVEYDYVTARQRLLADFPDVREVFATTAPATLLIVHSGADQRDAWRDAVLDVIGAREPVLLAKSFAGCRRRPERRRVGGVMLSLMRRARRFAVAVVLATFVAGAALAGEASVAKLAGRLGGGSPGMAAPGGRPRAPIDPRLRRDLPTRVRRVAAARDGPAYRPCGAGRDDPVPAGGLVAISAGAKALRRGGMPRARAAPSMVALLLLVNAPNLIALGVFGLALRGRLLPGPSAPVLTIVPAVIALSVVGATVLLPAVFHQRTAPRAGNVVNRRLSRRSSVRSSWALSRP